MRTIAKKGFTTIRVDDTDGGVVFCAYDVCVALGLGNGNPRLRQFVENTVGVSNTTRVNVSGCEVMFITCEGVGMLADAADMTPERRDVFKRWVEGECRKTPVPVKPDDAAVSVFKYKDNTVTFRNTDGDLMVNATQMAKAFGKTCNDWLKTEQSKRMVNAISTSKKIDVGDLVLVINGGNTGNGTWMHEDVALVFAQWLSPEFYLWCNDRIKELMNGSVPVSDDQKILNAMNILNRRVEESRRQLSAANEIINEMRQDYDYSVGILNSEGTYTLTECAKELGMRNVKTLVDELLRRRILFRQSGRLLPYADYSDKGYFATRTSPYVRDGVVCYDKYAVVTERGRKFLRGLFETLF